MEGKKGRKVRSVVLLGQCSGRTETSSRLFIVSLFSDLILCMHLPIFDKL